MVIVNTDAFTEKNLERAGYKPTRCRMCASASSLVEIPMTRLTLEALKDLSISQREAGRSKNFFALGLMYWLYGRPIEATIEWIESRFDGEIGEANCRVLMAGYHFGETSELFPVSFAVPGAKIQPGVYRNITGNTALALGCVAASVCMERPLVIGAYPITPATEVLHELAKHRNFGIKTFQAEDEIAAAAAAVGASFAGMLGLTVTSGPGLLLKQETINLAVRRRAAAGDRGRAACGSLHRAPDQGGAGRPALCALRAQLRQRASDPRACDARRMFLGDARSVPNRRRLHDARDRALRLVSREQRRAVAAFQTSTRCRATRSSSAPRSKASCPICATPRRWRVPGRSRAHPASSTASAVSRSRTVGATSRTCPRTTSV